MEKKTAGCIGTGVMGSALMNAVAKVAGGAQVLVRDADPDRTREFCRSSGCVPAQTNREIASSVRYLFIAVKPQYLKAALEEFAPALDSATVVVSMAAGVKIEAIRAFLGGHAKVVRIMPNTPAAVGSGMIAIAPDASVTEEETRELQRLLSAAGLTELTGESLMDAVTAVSGSGPAYAYLFTEALADAGVRMGMPRAQAIRYAAQTLKGAAEMVLQTGQHPGALKDSVCSPAGTTIAAVTKLEEKGFRHAVIEGAMAAWERSRELGK